MKHGTKIAVLLVVAIGILLAWGCDDDDGASASSFECYQPPPSGGAWRECAPELSLCGEQGCFEREQAYCFKYRFSGLSPEQQDRTLLTCTPTMRECEEWNADRKNVVNRSLGGCFKASPDEYPE